MEITREVLRAVGADIDVALALIGKKHGLLLVRGNARFSPQEANFKIEMRVTNDAALAAQAALAGDPSVAQDLLGASAKDIQAAEDFKKMAHKYGMKPEWLGRKFTYGRSELKIIGLLPNKHKNNVLIGGDRGGRYIISPAEVIARM